MQNLSYTYAISGQLDESLYWARRAWPLSARGAGDAYHVSVPLLLLRDDELSRQWLSHAERLPDHSRTQLTAASLEVYRGDIAGALARVRVRAQHDARDSEVSFMRNDLAVLALADDAEALNEEMFRTAPEVPGMVLPESGRLRYAFLATILGSLCWPIAPGPRWPPSVSAPGNADCSILRRCSDVPWSRGSASTEPECQSHARKSPSRRKAFVPCIRPHRGLCRSLDAYFINKPGDEQMGSKWSDLDMFALWRHEEWEDSPKGYTQAPAQRLLMVSQNFTSWNQIGEWLRRVEALRYAA